MGPTVILLEDDPAVRQLVRYGLARYRLDVREVATEAEAVARIAVDPGQVGAVVAGGPASGLDAGALVAAVRTAAPAVPVFFLCGDSLDATHVHEAGVEVFLKPHGLLEMCDAVAVAAALSCRTSAAAIMSRS
jgi:DNA-binding response OmpR family regulator